jgi:hypothetical protein
MSPNLLKIVFGPIFMKDLPDNCDWCGWELRKNPPGGPLKGMYCIRIDHYGLFGKKFISNCPKCGNISVRRLEP